MERIIISIIIPVYNGEKYLRQCVDSILQQTYSDFELICVDDGSTDSSYEILEKYAKQDNRISIIRQKNKYAGVARNNGMKLAKGKYLLFLDSDDFFEQNMLELLVERAEKDATEILVFNAFQYDNVSQQVINTVWSPLKTNLFGTGIKSAEEIADVIFEFATSAPWNKLFLREFIEQNQLVFQDIKRTNDLYFVYAAFSCARRIGILDKKLIYYRDNNKESLQGSGEETPTIFAKALYVLKDLLIERGYWEEFRYSFTRMAISVCLYNLNNMKSKNAYNKLISALRGEIFLKLDLGTDKVNSLLQQAICDKQDIIVYGAGTLSKTIINYLLCECKYETDNITIVVSDTANNIDKICGIEVQSIEQLPKNKVGDLVIIAVAEEKSQDEIKNSIKFRGIYRSVAVGFGELASLMRMRRQEWKV